MSVRIHAGVLHVAIPEIAIDIVGERGWRGEEREAEEEGEGEDDALRPDRFPKTCQVWETRVREDEEGRKVEGEDGEVAREVVEERRAAQRAEGRHGGPEGEAGKAEKYEG